MGENRTDAHSVGSDKDRLTIAEAAALLGVHKNTVRNRIKDGTYEAEKVITERGQTYMIERKSLLTNSTTNALSSASQQVVGTAPMEFVQELLRPFVSELGDVREELGAERARRRIAEERAASLEAELQELREVGEAQKLPQMPQSEDIPGPAEKKTPPDDPAQARTATEKSPERRSWWRRMFQG